VPATKSVIVGYDLVTAYGWGVDATWQGLLTGTSAIGPCERFQTTAFATSNAATISELDNTSEESLTLQMCRPLMKNVRADLSPETLVLLATTVGEIEYLESSLLDGSVSGGPEESCPDRLLHKIERLLGVSSNGMVVSAACASSSAAIAEAASLIRLQQHHSVLILGCDVVSEFVFSGFSALGALDPEVARPFDRSRGGLTLGEAAGYLLLMSEENALRDGRPILGEIAGWGLSADACHMTAPCQDGAGLVNAIRKALRSAGMSADDVACISAHGTATAYNDAMEIAALRTAFPGRPLPTYSVKGAVGHTLGAAGIVDTIVAAETLRHKIVPPTVGLMEAGPDGVGWVATEAQAFEGDVTVSTNAGFGGINTALVLRRSATPENQRRASRPADVATHTDVRAENEVEIALAGVGWIVGNECGTRRKGNSGPNESLSSLHVRLKHQSVSPNPIREFGRFDEASKLTCCAVALALEDASPVPRSRPEEDLGIVGTNAHGALETNSLYYKDYLENGRTLARGNLFVYTLASSPLTAAAVHFGCLGPILHLIPSSQDAAAPLRCAERLIMNRQAPGMLVLWRAKEDALCVLLNRADETPPAGTAGHSCNLGLGDLLPLASASMSVPELVLSLARATEESDPGGLR